MIIFDLDGTLADCEHRRHLIDSSKNPDIIHGIPPIQPRGKEIGIGIMRDYDKNTGLIWRPRWDEFYEECYKDKPIKPTIHILNMFLYMGAKIEVWSGRSETVREKTEDWLVRHTVLSSKYPYEIRMRPKGDSTPDDVLKEMWLNERCADLMEARMEDKNPNKHDIECVFDDRPKVVRMWRRRGIHVFNCCQHDEEF